MVDHDRDSGYARTVSVAPERLPGWLDGFADRHGAVSARIAEGALELRAADGAAARLRPPLPWSLEAPAGADPQQALLDHVGRDRTVGAVLVRKGGAAVGVLQGRRLLESKINTAYVQGRTKAGGWSQQRYARRRGQQAASVYAAVADLTVRIVLPRLGELAAVATGGDRPAVTAVLADPRLVALEPLVLARVHPVPDPRLAVLQSFPDQFLAIEIDLNDLA